MYTVNYNYHCLLLFIANIGYFTMPTTLVLSSTSNIQKSTKSIVLTSIQFTELSSTYTMTSTIVPTIVLPDSADNLTGTVTVSAY